MGGQAVVSKGLTTGQVIAGKYRLEELLGAGGFGTVYRARELALGREVALKILAVELITVPAEVKRFVREAQVVQQLKHPNTVCMYDVGQLETGQPYIAFELLHGTTLGQVIALEAPLPPGRVAQIANQVLEALMVAHDLGFIHRDIKPDNLFLTDPVGEPDTVKVLDFGVAKLVFESEVARTQLTAQGIVLGTPAYMAPELVRGEPIGPPVDLYALGLVMAEMLTGQVVVQARTAIEACLLQSSFEPLRLDAIVRDSPLGVVIEGATAKPLEHRFRSAEEMIGALEAAHDGITSGAFDETITASSQEALAVSGELAPQSAALTSDGDGDGRSDVSTVREHPPESPQSGSGSSLLRVMVGIAAVMALLVFGAVAGVGYYLWASQATTSQPAEAGRSGLERPIGETALARLRSLPPEELDQRLSTLTSTLVASRLIAGGWTVNNVEGSQRFRDRSVRIWFTHQRVQGRMINGRITLTALLHEAGYLVSEDPRNGYCIVGSGRRVLNVTLVDAEMATLPVTAADLAETILAAERSPQGASRVQTKRPGPHAIPVMPPSPVSPTVSPPSLQGPANTTAESIRRLGAVEVERRLSLMTQQFVEDQLVFAGWQNVQVLLVSGPNPHGFIHTAEHALATGRIMATVHNGTFPFAVSEASIGSFSIMAGHRVLNVNLNPRQPGGTLPMSAAELVEQLFR